jgi:hypothetical protein
MAWYLTPQAPTPQAGVNNSRADSKGRENR